VVQKSDWWVTLNHCQRFTHFLYLKKTKWLAGLQKNLAVFIRTLLIMRIIFFVLFFQILFKINNGVKIFYTSFLKKINSHQPFVKSW
jgi:hypothetical protein